MNLFKFEKIEDMVNMMYLNEVFVLYNLRFCYYLGMIYVSYFFLWNMMIYDYKFKF